MAACASVRLFAERARAAKPAFEITPISDQRCELVTLNNLGSVFARQGRLADAEPLLEESLRLAREFGAAGLVTLPLHGLGDVALGRGDLAAAAALHGEALALCRDEGDREGIAAGLEAFARIAASAGDAPRTLVLTGAAARLREEIRAEAEPSARAQLGASAARARAMLEAAEADRRLEEGRRLSMAEAVAIALELATTARGDARRHGSPGR